MLYGEPLVAACAAAGTDYVDLTGEPEFVDRMWLENHAEAERTGARLVHCCGFDSIPHDLGAYFTVKQLPEGVPLTVDGYVRSNAKFSGRHLPLGDQRLRPRPADDRRRAKERKPQRAARRPAARSTRAGFGIRHDDELGGWVVPLPTIDGGDRAPLGRGARALRPRLHLRPPHGRQAPARRSRRWAPASAPSPLLAPLPPTRKLLLKLKAPGEGPSEAERERSWFRVSFVGEGGGKRVVTEVSGGDPGYAETAKMLAESGLCLAFDELPPSAGQVTTAAAMGDALLARLQAAGMGFQVLDRG